MIFRMFFLDFTKNKKNLFLKFLIPFVIVTATFQIGYGKITFVMLLIFAVITGSGLKIIKLKNSGLYKRLIIGPSKNESLFSEIAVITSFFYFLQFIPTLIVVSLFDSVLIFLYSLIAILIVVLIGILIGIHAKSLGEIHLNSVVFLIPLIAFTMTDSAISYIFPFAAIFHSNYLISNLVPSCIVALILILILMVDVKRL
jgi:hypothetical protein